MINKKPSSRVGIFLILGGYFYPRFPKKNCFQKVRFRLILGEVFLRGYSGRSSARFFLLKIDDVFSVIKLAVQISVMCKFLGKHCSAGYSRDGTKFFILWTSVFLPINRCTDTYYRIPNPENMAKSWFWVECLDIFTLKLLRKISVHLLCKNFWNEKKNAGMGHVLMKKVLAAPFC